MSPQDSGAIPVRVGVIGCGALGLVHARRLCAVPGVTVAAISDPDGAALRRVAQDLEAQAPAARTASTFADYSEMLRDVELDAVCINSPNRWHAEHILHSLERGLHVLCEKPLSMAPQEVRAVVSAAEAAGKIVAISYQRRYLRDSRALRREIQSGAWGRITSVSVFGCEDWMTPNTGTWRHDPLRCPGGFFADANGHQLDIIFWVSGLVGRTVRATMDTRGTPVPMVTWGEATLVPSRNGTTESGGSGVPFTFTFVGDAHHWREEISIQTERVDFLIRDTTLHWSGDGGRLAPFPCERVDPAIAAEPDLPDLAFIDAVRGGPPVLSAPDTVWPVLDFTLAALRSAEHGSDIEHTG